MSRRLLIVLVGFVVALGLLAAGVIAPFALDGWRTDDTSAVDAALTDQCSEVPDSASRVTLTGADGRLLGAAAVGAADAKTTVVLRQGASQTLCDWLGWADEIAATHGVRVLLFDRRGQGSSPGDPGLTSEPDDLVAAASLARGDGADEIVLVGSSMGNSVMFSALPALDAEEQSICAVVSISPVLTSGALDGRSPAPLPATTWVTWESPDARITGFAESLQRDAERQGVTARMLPVDSEHHSLALVKNHDDVRAFVSEAVGSCA